MGIAANRSVGNAVYRNRAKRRIRASLYIYLPDMEPGFDMIFLARKPVVDADFGEILLTVSALLSKAGVLKKKEHPGSKNAIGIPE
jgi:ribonuclease P protein component